MKRRDFIKTASTVGVVGAAASAFATPAISQNRIEWKMQTTWRENSPLLWTGPKLVADYVSKMSDGRLTIKLYAAGEIAPPLQVMDVVADGGLEMGHGYPPYWAGKLPAMQFFTPLPFGITTQEQNAWFLYGGGQEIADKVYGELGVKFMPSGNTSVQSAGWFNKEINSIEDYQGMKIRSGGLGSKVLAKVGATPVQMPLGEVPQALQTNSIDGADFVGPFNDMAFGLHKVAKYCYWPGWMEPCGVLDCFINKAAWDGLSDDLKAIVEAANAMANNVVLSEFVAKNAQAYQTLQTEHGVKMQFLNDETLAVLGKVAGEVIIEASEADALSKEVYDSLMSFRKLVMPYTNTSELAFMKARNLDFPYGG
ncbi:MAG: TRAP transporter substrate-binding protein [Alphaproteobacteria bacterium]|nr:TRAP transporter substrate-binding protein [Alphaproteobacteria bacterium]